MSLSSLINYSYIQVDREERYHIEVHRVIWYNIMEFTCVPLETGRKIAPAPATFALALAIDGRREPSAEAER
jgi:hypothetical protein